MLLLEHKKIPGNAVHKAALSSQRLVYQALQEWWKENETNHRRLATCKWGVWKNELSESFGSRWASKVKTKCMLRQVYNESVFWPCMHVNLLLMTPKTKIWTFITHNRDTKSYLFLFLFLFYLSDSINSDGTLTSNKQNSLFLSHIPLQTSVLGLCKLVWWVCTNLHKHGRLF